jgi:hypothetical protein
LAAASYGGLEVALERMKAESWADIPFAGFFASTPATLLGGIVGPLAGASALRRPVLDSSALGGAAAALLGTGAGLLAGWVGWWREPYAMMTVWVALGLSVPAGRSGVGWEDGGWAAPNSTLQQTAASIVASRHESL